jgi:7-cyano-7-deazaguanine reductase
MSKSDSPLTHLGRESRGPASPAEAVLDKVPAPGAGHLYAVRFTCPEFTTLCPITGQPDFAHLVLDYVPRDFILESKSFKLYLASFRNHGAFHEAATTEIALRLVRELEPRWLRLCGFWFPRGGIPIDVFYQTGVAPQGVHIPDPGVSPYRGRA